MRPEDNTEPVDPNASKPDESSKSDSKGDDKKPERSHRRTAPPPVTIMNTHGNGTPVALPLDGDSEVAHAYREHMRKPLVRTSEKEQIAEQLCLYLAICREQGIAFHYNARKVDLAHAATGALFFNQTGYEIVTPAGRNKLSRALAADMSVRELCLMLQAASRAVAEAPRTERDDAVQSKVDLAGLISSLAGKSGSVEEFAAALLKLVK